MSGSRTSLRAGQQSRAARRVADEVEQVHAVLKDLATSVESAMPGFVGGASAGLAEALKAWFDVAGQLPVVLDQYASALATVDTTTVGSDASGARGLAGAATGTPSSAGPPAPAAPPGSSGLNLGPAGAP